jgi:Zn-dependent membrane protease YugP
MFAKSGSRGVDVARAILTQSGIHDVEITEIEGHLTDHYDPGNKTLALSSENYHSSSLAAMGVAAHEAGHAIQHKVGYRALKFRMQLIPITHIASQILPIALICGIVMHSVGLVRLAAVVYIALALFQLVTLPVEFDASRRARKHLASMGFITKHEIPGIKNMLNAAGLTYVAAFVSSVAYLIHLFLSSKEK